jgi:hypothetical protein
MADVDNYVIRPGTISLAVIRRMQSEGARDEDRVTNANSFHVRPSPSDGDFAVQRHDVGVVPKGFNDAGARNDEKQARLVLQTPDSYSLYLTTESYVAMASDQRAVAPVSEIFFSVVVRKHSPERILHGGHGVSLKHVPPWILVIVGQALRPIANVGLNKLGLGLHRRDERTEHLNLSGAYFRRARR